MLELLTYLFFITWFLVAMYLFGWDKEEWRDEDE